MKKFYFAAVLVLIFLNPIFAQSSKYQWLAKDSWNFGFGVSYPKYISTSVNVTGETGYGGYLSIQRNFSEHVGMRLKTSYLHLEGKAGNTVTNNLFLGDLDLLYYFIPCEPISPYAGAGLGLFYNTIENSPTTALNKSNLDYQLNFNFGAEWRISEKWNLKTELGYHTAASSKFDGTYGTQNGGVLGGITDAYMTFDLGVQYFFSKGEKSNLCDMYDGVNAQIDYDKIEEIVKRYAVTQPAEVDYDRIEDIVKKHKSNVSSLSNNWVLLGVNFDFNKSTLRPESLPILYNAAEILLNNPDIRVEIQGHTDNIGSESYNKKLSLERAQAVRNFLIAKGVAPNRMTAVGMGESNPIMDNSTPEGRQLNRRIEFKVLR